MLLEVLREKEPRLAVIYHGAVWARAQSSHPDLLPHAAHGMRELMEKLPLYLDVPVPKKDASLTAKVNELVGVWEKARTKSTCHSKVGWRGEIDHALRKFLSAAGDFFDWQSVSAPRRKQRTAQALRGLDPTGRPLPAPIEDLHVREWHTLSEYFQAVSHHGGNATPDEYDAYVQQAETFILDRLRPRTFEDHARLEKLIQEAEA